MNLQQIKYFLAVVDIGTFLGASEHVYVSQPTLSAGIKKLEISLGVQLFYRGSRNATLTSEGEVFLQHARSIYQQLELVKTKLTNKSAILKIGIINTIPMDFIEDILKSYKEVYPSTLCEIEVGSLKFLRDKLLVKKIDLLFSTPLNINIKSNSLFDEMVKLVVSNQHPLANYESISISQINNHAFIERTHCESWDEVHSLFEKHSINLHSVCRAESDETILPLVSSGVGVSIMPWRRSPYDVKFIEIKELQLKRKIKVYYASSTHSPFADIAKRVYEK